MKDFGRVLTAMVTPMDGEARVDFKQAQDLAVYLAENGSDGLVVSGTTGESPTLTQEEKLKLFSAVLEAVKGKALVIAGTGSNSTAATLALTQQAEKLGVDGIMLVSPYYNRPTQEGMYQHFRTIADNTALPIILYNVPGRTASNLLPITVARLAAHPNIVAIKEASGNLDQVSELKGLLPKDFIVYSGDDSLTLPMLALGARGIISVASHVVGREIKEMVLAFEQGELEKAQALHLKLFPLFKALFMVSNPIPVKKALMLMGHPVGPPRLPLLEAAPVETEAIRTALRNFGLPLT